MKRFETNKIEKYLPIIEECFATDDELLYKWHIEAPADLDTCVRRTFNDLKNAPTIQMYAIKENGEIIGFFGTEKAGGSNWLTSFFIKPKYRDKDVFDYFWNTVKDITGNKYFTAIYEKNERAKKWLEKNGFNLIQITKIKNDYALTYSN